MSRVSFVIPGTPVAWQRSDRNGNRSYDTPRNKAKKKEIGTLAMVAGAYPTNYPVRLEVTAAFEPAKSHSKRVRAQLLGCYHTQKPDLDNIAKLIKDALNGVAYADDSQVAQVVMVKKWGPVAQTFVAIDRATERAEQ